MGRWRGGFHLPAERVSRSCHPACSMCAWSCEAGVSLDCGPQTETVGSPCVVGRISYWPGAHQIALGILLVSFPGVGVTAAFFLSHFILMTCFKVFSQNFKSAFFFSFYFVLLRVKPWALHVLGLSFTTELHPQVEELGVIFVSYSLPFPCWPAYTHTHRLAYRFPSLPELDQ